MKKNIIITITALISCLPAAFADTSDALVVPGQADAEVQAIKLVDVSEAKAARLFRASVENQVKAINKWLAKGDVVNALSYFAALYDKDAQKATDVMLADEGIQFALMTQLPAEKIRQYFEDWMGVEGEDDEGNITYKEDYEIKFQSIDLGQYDSSIGKDYGDFALLNIPLACVHRVLMHDYSIEVKEKRKDPGYIVNGYTYVKIKKVNEADRDRAYSHIAKVFEELDTDFVLKMITTSKRYNRKPADEHRKPDIMRRITDNGELKSFYEIDYERSFCPRWTYFGECVENPNGCKPDKQKVDKDDWYLEENQECSLPFYFETQEGNPADYVVDKLLPYWIDSNEALATELLEQILNKSTENSKKAIETLPCERLMDLLGNFSDELLNQVFEICENDDEAFDSLFGEDIFGEALPAIGDGNQDAA